MANSTMEISCGTGMAHAPTAAGTGAGIAAAVPMAGIGQEADAGCCPVGLGEHMDVGGKRIGRNPVEGDPVAGNQIGGNQAVERARAFLPTALAAVVWADLAGGVWDIAAGRSTLASAWGPDATLCAPWPMIAFQFVAVTVAVRSPRLPGRIAAGLLATACAVSVASGFFDGQLARADLTPAEVAFQVLLLTMTGVLGGVAVAVAAARKAVAPDATQA
jgi:hypothetical protein